MLWQRVLTASILAPLVVAGVLWLPTDWLLAVLAAVVLLGADEWTRLCRLQGVWPRVAFVAALGGLLALLWLGREAAPLWPAVAAAGALWWLVITLVLWRFRRSGFTGGDGQAFWVWSGGMVLLPAWVGVGLIHRIPEHGPAALLLLLLMIWAADSGAFFAGRRFGRNKLAPGISPGKTLEGVYGAFAAVALLAVAFSLLRPAMAGPAALLLLGALAVPISVAGDLYESAAKRRADLKDSGRLLPGHGGVLDRIDSLLAAAPVFAVLYPWIIRL